MSGGVWVFGGALVAGVHAGKMDDSEKLKIISGSWRNFECDKFSFRREGRKFNLSKIFCQRVSCRWKNFLCIQLLQTQWSRGREKKKRGNTCLHSTRLECWLENNANRAKQRPPDPFSSVFPSDLFMTGRETTFESTHPQITCRFSTKVFFFDALTYSWTTLGSSFVFSPSISKSNVAEEIKKFK